MTSLDYFRQLNLEASIILNYPKGMTGVLSAVESFVKQQGKYVVDMGDISVEQARNLVAEATGNQTTYYIIRSNSTKVWGILKSPVESDNIRVIGVFHGKIPDDVPKNAIVIDVGKSLNRKVSKEIARELASVMVKPGTLPEGDFEKLYDGILALCYEVLYSPEYRTFSHAVAALVPVATAFDFMFNPPGLLAPRVYKSAVNDFVAEIHGYLE